MLGGFQTKQALEGGEAAFADRLAGDFVLGEVDRKLLGNHLQHDGPHHGTDGDRAAAFEDQPHRILAQGFGDVAGEVTAGDHDLDLGVEGLALFFGHFLPGAFE